MLLILRAAGHGSPTDDLEALKRTIEKGSMPPVRYKMIHWKSSLTENEIEIIKDWINKSKKLIVDGEKN